MRKGKGAETQKQYLTSEDFAGNSQLSRPGLSSSLHVLFECNGIKVGPICTLKIRKKARLDLVAGRSARAATVFPLREVSILLASSP